MEGKKDIKFIASDDFLDFLNTLTPEQREQVSKALNSIKPGSFDGIPIGEVFAIDIPLHAKHSNTKNENDGKQKQ